MYSDGRTWSVKLANSATTDRSDIYEGAGTGYALAAAKERFFNRWILDKNHRIFRDSLRVVRRGLQTAARSSAMSGGSTIYTGHSSRMAGVRCPAAVRIGTVEGSDRPRAAVCIFARNRTIASRISFFWPVRSAVAAYVVLVLLPWLDCIGGVGSFSLTERTNSRELSLPRFSWVRLLRRSRLRC